MLRLLFIQVRKLGGVCRACLRAIRDNRWLGSQSANTKKNPPARAKTTEPLQKLSDHAGGVADTET